MTNYCRSTVVNVCGCGVGVSEQRDVTHYLTPSGSPGTLLPANAGSHTYNSLMRSGAVGGVISSLTEASGFTELQNKKKRTFRYRLKII